MPVSLKKSDLRIKTDGLERPLEPWTDLFPVERNDISYLEEDEKYENRFLRYKEHVYDIYDMLNCEGDFNGWDAYHSHTYWSGIVIKLLEDDYVLVGVFW